MTAPPEVLDLAFAWMLRATAQASAVVLVILAARLVLRDRLGPGVRYALWLLLALPLVAWLLPAGRFSLPTPLARDRSLGPAPRAALDVARPADAGLWEIHYGPVDLPSRPQAAAAAPVVRVHGFRVAAVVWLVGVMVLALRVAVAHVRAIAQANRSPAVDDPTIQSVLEECRRIAGARRSPRVVESADDTGPALLGVLRPRLLLPAGAPARLSRAELRFVFLHELVHLKRGDVLAEWLLTLLQVAHWFNPLVWLAASWCRVDRELACDAAVVALAGETGRTEYGRTILKLATERPPAAWFARGVTSTVGILETHSPLERRLRMIALAPDGRTARWPAGLVALLALGLVTLTNAQTPKAENDTAKPRTAQPSSDAPGGEGRPQENVLATPEDWPDVSSRTLAAPAPVDARVAAANAAVREQLDRPLAELNFDGATFVDVIDLLRDVTGTNIFVNWKALESAGVSRDTPLTARLRNIRFAKALTVLLDSATGGADKPKLGYSVDDGVITITSADDLLRDTLVRVYDIRDLIIPVPDFDPEADAGKERERANDPNNPARQQAIDAIIKLLRETVAPEQWGKSAAARELQGQLIVTATPETHRTIIRLIEQLRESRALQVTVEAKFIAVDDDVLAALPAGLREAVAGELRAGADPAPASKAAAGSAAPEPKDVKDPSKAVVLDAAQVDQVLRAVQKSPKSSIVSAPRLTLFNGQRAYVLTGTQRAYVADYAIVRQANGETKYEPKIETAQTGVMFRAQATASADRKFATLTLNPKLTYLGAMEEVPWDKSPAGENMTVQRPKLLVSQLATTASVRDGATLLLGGLRGYEAAAGADGKGKAQLANVLMLVKPTLIVQREVEAKNPHGR